MSRLPIDSGDSSIYDKNTYIFGVADGFHPDLVVLLAGHVGDELQVVLVEQAAVLDADDADLGVRRHRDSHTHAEPLCIARLVERQSVVEDLAGFQRKPFDRR